MRWAGAFLGLTLAAGPAAAQVASSAVPPRPVAEVRLPGPDALYDPDQGAPEALASPETPRGTLFPGLEAPWRADLQRFRLRLFQDHGITFFASYQQLAQYATDTRPGVRQDWAVGGWFGYGATWTPIDRGGDYEGTFVFRGGWRGALGGNNTWPAPFGLANLGSAWSAYEFTSWNNRFAVEDLFYEQHIGRNFNFRIGNQAPQATLNFFRFKDARTGFTASPLAFHDTIPYPAFGAGLSFRWRSFADGFYVNGALNDMNGSPGQRGLDWSTLNANQLFSGVEVGHQWRRPNGEFDHLSLLVFYAGTRRTFNVDTSPNSPGGGFKINGELQRGRVVGFASYTYNEARGGGISTTFTNHTAVAGAAYLRPFGINGEAAVAGMWSRPFSNLIPGLARRDQYGVEAYWNIAVTPNSTLTPGVQLVVNPAFNPSVDFIAIPQIKFRVFL
ncbi:carbohydrate porin [Roseomonas sp. CCTCC AB2023176]|uniref:carbohydrate porin n=1 Tax=Roseomonas sp. CCTCC AB2023176 TaxID=3342640 RepID=UPI0035DD47E1